MSYEAIVRLLADLVVSIDLGGEAQIDTDFASDLLDGVAAVMERLAEGERAQIASIVDSHAVAETDERRRNALHELPEHLGLTPDEK